MSRKLLLRYLKGSTTLTSVFNRGTAFELFGYSVLDRATDEDDRKSTSGFCFKVKGIIVWCLWLQQAATRNKLVLHLVIVRLCVALVLAAQEAIFMQELLDLISCLPMVTKPTLVYGDNQGATALANNPFSHKRAKYIETRHHFIQDLIEAKKLLLEYTSTADNVANIFTKNLPKTAFKHYRNQLFCQL